MATFTEIVRQTDLKAKEISDWTGVPLPLVHNVMQYAKRLSYPDRPDCIDELVFIAQMGTRFGITSMFHIKLMADAIRRKDSNLIHVQDYSKLICMFYSNNLEQKIDFVFSVYDFYHDGNLCNKEMNALLQTSIVSFGDEDNVEQVKELIDIVLNAFDLNRDNLISLEEFRSLVQKNTLNMQMLGQVLPHKEDIDSFMSLLKGKTRLEVSKLFTHERTKCLQEPRAVDVRRITDTLYPVVLDLP